MGARQASSFKRKEPAYVPQPKVLVICEDSKSSKTYLSDAATYFRARVQVEIIHCGKTDPKNIVEDAVARQSKFEFVYCVIDRDTHEHFDQAIKIANQFPKIKIIDSHPSFEFWLLIHFGYCRRPFRSAGGKSAGDQVVHELEKCPGMDKYDKGKVKGLFGLLLESNKFMNARQISPQILNEAVMSGELNPSTKVHELIDHFERLSEPLKK